MSVRRQDITGHAPTRTEPTTQFYRDRAAAKIAEYGRELGVELGLEQAIEYFAGLDGRYSDSTLRSIRAWFLQAVCDLRDASALNEVRAEELAERIRKAQPEATQSKSTSAKKQKYVSFSDIARVSRWLHQKGDPLNIGASQFLRLSILVGLRPSEWRSARLNGTELTWMAAKCTNSRGLRSNPSLRLCSWPREWLAILEDFLRFLSDYTATDRDWKLCTESLRSHIAYACKVNGVARICPYSARHVFVATEKKLGTDPVLLSIKLNHRTTRTQTSHYAHKRGGLPMSRSLTAADQALMPEVRIDNRRWTDRETERLRSGCRP